MIPVNEKITTDNIFINDQKLKKKGMLQFISECVAKKSGIPQEKLFNALLAREAIGSTGFERGIAIPHCQIDAAKEFYYGLVISHEGIKFDSYDGKKSQIFFYIVGPSDQKQEHIKILSATSRLLSTPNLIEKLLSAKTTDEIQELILHASLTSSVSIENQEKMLFQIMVSNDLLFNQMVKIAVEQGIESIMVLEGESASAYLYKMPLFSSFWSAQGENSRKLILLTVDKTLTNNLIREFYLIPDIEKKEKEFSLNVTNLYYSAGKLAL